MRARARDTCGVRTKGISLQNFIQARTMGMCCSGRGSSVQRASVVAHVEQQAEKTLDCWLACPRHCPHGHVHMLDEEEHCCGVFHRLVSSALLSLEVSKEYPPAAFDFNGCEARAFFSLFPCAATADDAHIFSRVTCPHPRPCRHPVR